VEHILTSVQAARGQHPAIVAFQLQVMNINVVNFRTDKKRPRLCLGLLGMLVIGLKNICLILVRFIYFRSIKYRKESENYV
jgi:hypothetical protein